MTPADLIASYLQIRNKKRALEEEHKKALAPYNDVLNRIETELAKIMQDTGLENLPGGGGTAYRTTRTSVTVDDWDLFLGWVRENNAWHALERRASKTAVEEILADEEALPPGLTLARAMVVNVRKT